MATFNSYVTNYQRVYLIGSFNLPPLTTMTNHQLGSWKKITHEATLDAEAYDLCSEHHGLCVRGGISVLTLGRPHWTRFGRLGGWK